MINKIIAPAVALIVTGFSYLFPLPTAQGVDIKSHKEQISKAVVIPEKRILEFNQIPPREHRKVTKHQDKVTIVFHDAPSSQPIYIAPTTNPTPSPQPVQVVNNPTSAQSFAREYMLSRYNWGSAQFYCVYQIWEHESGWETTAANPSGAYGIPQSLPGDRMAAYGSDWRTNPDTQIRWGLAYISERYGTPCNAWSIWQTRGWY